MLDPVLHFVALLGNERCQTARLEQRLIARREKTHRGSECLSRCNDAARTMADRTSGSHIYCPVRKAGLAPQSDPSVCALDMHALNLRRPLFRSLSLRSTRSCGYHSISCVVVGNRDPG